MMNFFRWLNPLNSLNEFRNVPGVKKEGGGSSALVRIWVSKDRGKGWNAAEE